MTIALPFPGEPVHVKRFLHNVLSPELGNDLGSGLPSLAPPELSPAWARLGLIQGKQRLLMVVFALPAAVLKYQVLVSCKASGLQLT